MYGDEMQRAAFPELQGRPPRPRHRRPQKPDRVLLGLKIATFLAAGGLIGIIVLLASSTLPNQVAVPAENPPTQGQSGDDAPRPVPTTSTEPLAIAPPALRTETARIDGRPAAPPTSRKAAPPPIEQPARPPARTFPVIGEPCSPPGTWSVTREYQPVVCASTRPGEKPRWYRVF
jgi:hypothetical protein